jgi:hypothetical protein
MFPAPTMEEVTSTSTILSVNITGGAVAWCKIRKQDHNAFVVEALGQKPLAYRPKMHFLAMLNEVRIVVVMYKML